MSTLLTAVGIVFKPLMDAIDKLHYSDQEKAEMRAKLYEAQAQLFVQAMNFEARALEAQSRVVEAEAKSESFLTANWRPIIMLTFGVLVVARWFGYSAPDIPLEIETELWSLLKIGLGGYVAGRSLEKVAESVGPLMNRTK